MKSILKSNNILARLMLVMAGFFTSLVAFAQDKKVDVNINTKGDGNFFNQPWVWIVGGILLIVLLVALLRPSDTKIIKE